MFFSGCSKDDALRPAQLLVTVSGLCSCNVFVYDDSGFCIHSRLWDCNETKLMIINIKQFGTISVVAELRGVSISEIITVKSGVVYEVGLIF